MIGRLIKKISIKFNSLITFGLLLFFFRTLFDTGFIWSKGYAFLASSYGTRFNVLLGTEKLMGPLIFKIAYKKNVQSYWIKMGSDKSGVRCNLRYFAEYILPYQKKPFILYTSDGDLIVPKHVDKKVFKLISEHPMLETWYAQNLAKTQLNSSKLSFIPIGLDLHTRPLQALKNCRHVSTPALSKTLRVVCDCLINHTIPDRKAFRLPLPVKAPLCFLDKYIPNPYLVELYRASTHVLSLAGNGPDCHRTWEAISCGCAVVLPSNLDLKLPKIDCFVFFDDPVELLDINTAYRFREVPHIALKYDFWVKL